MHKLLSAIASFSALTAPHALAQAAAQPTPPEPCKGATLTGLTHDGTNAVIPHAALALDGKPLQVTGDDGQFRLTCLADGPHKLTVVMPGFAPRDVTFTVPASAPLDVLLTPEVTGTQVNVTAADTNSVPTSVSAGPTQTISGAQLQALADDPDDLLKELQEMASATGGNPANTTIAVDGFQGSSKLPPKSSINYIRVNPDQFSAEYREPPFDQGRVEVYTKPGQKTYHGALFTTNGSPWENARDPFSVSKAAIGKQRYGFELGGPVRKEGSDFSMTLEHRSIDNFAVVNAITLDNAGNTTNTVANVATPQRLWLGTARVDWLLGQHNTFVTSYSANVNHLQNVGVGGTSLAETGYDSQQYEHMLRVSDVTTASALFMHEARLSLRWSGENDTPSSLAPQIQVAGAFTSGGNTLGAQRLPFLNIEFDDDAVFAPKNHAIKFGTQLQAYINHRQLPTNFNGTYTFGGGTAPVLNANNQVVAGQTTTISGIEQYRRAKLGLPGGTATAFSNVAGTSNVSFSQIQEALFFEDDWNIGKGFHLAYGARYALEVNPTTLSGFTPRVGLLWSPDQQGKWTLHAHFGMFTGTLGQNDTAEVLREDGVARVTSTVYNATYGNPMLNATPIHSRREFSPGIGTVMWGAENIGGTRSLPGGWNLSMDYYKGRIWNDVRSENINSPTNGSPTGPRPGPANINILQVQNSAQSRINAVFGGIENHSIKHLQFFFGGVRVEIYGDGDDDAFFTPQSSTSNAGEFAHRTNQQAWNLFGNGTLNLPYKLNLSADYNGGGDAHYNITTGFDNNGDGNFNDRPQYAAPGTPGAISTPYGLLTATGGTAVFGRNKGVMPWTIHLDMNLQRAFVLTRNAKAEHQQTITVNLRSSNVLNHLNVTTIGGVLGSPLFNQAYAADNGRRVEAGLRYSF